MYLPDLVLLSGLVVPTIPALAQQPVPVPSACFMLTNMFDPSKENGPDWEVDIREDVLEECMEFGDIYHIYIDRHSQVSVSLYVRVQCSPHVHVPIHIYRGMCTSSVAVL